MSTLILAENPSVARDLAAAVGATQRANGALKGNGFVVTWAIGHLVGLAQPHEMDPAWKPWRWDRLPILPKEWPLVALSQTADHFGVVKQLLADPEVESLVCATDAGREGELIFRYIYQLAECRKPFQRLWISSLTPDAIKDGFRKLRPGTDFDALGAAAEARSRADWLVGMNLSRAYTLRFGSAPGAADRTLLSVGRVQTPTLAMLVDRERAILGFVPEEYCEVVATFGDVPKNSYEATWFDPERREDDPRKAERLPVDGVRAAEIRARCEGRPGVVASCSGADKNFPPPLLYDLTELQRHANRLYGLTAKDTLTCAQALYEKHKLVTYPRTDSRHLSADVAATLGEKVANIVAAYGDAVAEGTGVRPLSKRFVDDTKVTDHHAIIPTGVGVGGKDLTQDERRVYDLVCRRLLMAWHKDHKTRVTTVITEVAGDEAKDLFRAAGTVVTQVGWKALDVDTGKPDKPKKKGKAKGEGAPKADAAAAPAEADDGEDKAVERKLPDGLAEGQSRPVTRVDIDSKKTAPPKRLTDATLLTAMETAGKTLDDHELEEAMSERGLGTPATRAAILETLLTRGYIERKGRSLRATDAGIALIDVVHEKVKSPAMTGEWELALKRMEKGEGTLPEFMARIEKYVIEVVGEVRWAQRPTPDVRRQTSGPQAQAAGVQDSAAGPGASVGGSQALAAGSQPSSAGPSPSDVRRQTSDVKPPALPALLRDRFHFDTFRPYQQEVCEWVAAGKNALLVMPTGSGKSLCYQLPGIARGGCTLVISPLIALMEDQVARLNAGGFRADRIHSGRSREESRAACFAYLEGRLDFLMIAPERLAVAGFPEMLAKRKPTLIAIDEAHCISHWGHDFRPDYRLLRQRLPLLRPAPIIAMTATATVKVQRDIIEQLDVVDAKPFIHGFRRENLAIEAAVRSPSERADAALEVLKDETRRPAIVYVPTRRQADEVAQALAKHFPTMAYHAGMEPAMRGAVQEAFLAGAIDVIVATIAFGMGIDKADVRTVIHLSLPGTVEGYYQEIGRAGRDGKPAKAILLYSWADRHMHEAFLERDYPEVEVLRALRAQVPAEGIAREDLIASCDEDEDEAEAAIAKLWVHGGVKVDADDRVFPGHDQWEPSYVGIRDHRKAQLDGVLDFAQSDGCRMLHLLRHFGETQDRRPCGQCDGCRPDACEVRRFRRPTTLERFWLDRVLDELRRYDGLATGTVYRKLCPKEELERRVFERYVDAMARCGVVRIAEDAFEADGRIVTFRRVHVNTEGVGLDAVTLEGEPEERAPVKPPKRRKGAARNAGTGATAGVQDGPQPDPAIVSRLRQWRLETAREEQIPAFRILTDRALRAIAAAKPGTLGQLLRLPGIGPRLAEKWGEDILRRVQG